MKIFKFIASFLLLLGIFVLMLWAIFRSNNKTCTDISIVIHSAKTPALLSVLDISKILEKQKVDWKGRTIKEIDLANINTILSQEDFIKSVDKVHILGTKLQIEVSLYEVLLKIETQNGNKFLLDVNGVYLPNSPNLENDVIFASGIFTDSYHKNATITPENYELYELFTIATLINKDTFYSELFYKLSVNNKQEIVLHPTVGNLLVLFGTIKDAENKFKTLKYMYEEVLPFMNENKYAQLDVRFTNRIVAKKNKI